MLESGWYSPASASSTEDLEQSRALMASPFICMGSPDIDISLMVDPSEVYKPLTVPVSPGFISMREDSMSQCSSVASELQAELSRPIVGPMVVGDNSASPMVVGDNSANENSAAGKGKVDTIYQRLTLGMEDAALHHGNFIMEKLMAGLFLLPQKWVDPNSKTPYSDVAKPRKKGKNGTPKRPMNAFMVFAQAERQKFISARASLDNAKISSHLGQVWKAVPLIHKPYRDYAAWLKELHEKEFPGYKYKPRKKKSCTAGSEVADKPKATRGRRQQKAKGSKPCSKPYHRPPLKAKQDPGNVFPPAEEDLKSVSPASAVMVPSPLTPYTPVTPAAPPPPPPPPSVGESIPSPGDHHRLAADQQASSYAHKLLAEMRDAGHIDFTANRRAVEDWEEEENTKLTLEILDLLANLLFPDNDDFIV